MKKSAFEKATEKAKDIPTWMELDEQEELFKSAAELEPGSQIVEIGCLYGGSTARLGLGSNNESNILVIDDFSWTPEGHPTASKERALANLESIGLTEVTIEVMDSLKASPEMFGFTEDLSIDLLFIDGGHSLEFVSHDLNTWGPKARKVLLHDYGNAFWTTIKYAVDDFLKSHREFKLDHVTGTVAVLVNEIPF